MKKELKPGLFCLFPNQNYLDLIPFQAGYADNDSNAFYGPAARNHYLFHYVISGAGTLTADNQEGKEYTFPVHAGQGFLIYPFQNTTYRADKQNPWEYVWIEFDGVHAVEVVNHAGLSMEAPIYKSSDPAVTQAMMQTMMKLAQETKDTFFYKMSCLYLFADYLIRSSSSAQNRNTKGSMSDYYLQMAFQFIEHNYMNLISVESIAQHCNIHRNQLLKIFKKAVGKGPQEYLITYRMSKAAQLLVTTKLSVNEISNAVGYPNQLHFSRAFKKIYGISPKQYQERELKTV